MWQGLSTWQNEGGWWGPSSRWSHGKRQRCAHIQMLRGAGEHCAHTQMMCGTGTPNACTAEMLCGAGAPMPRCYAALECLVPEPRGCCAVHESPVPPPWGCCAGVNHPKAAWSYCPRSDHAPILAEQLVTVAQPHETSGTSPATTGAAHTSHQHGNAQTTPAWSWLAQPTNHAHSPASAGYACLPLQHGGGASDDVATSYLEIHQNQEMPTLQ